MLCITVPLLFLNYYCYEFSLNRFFDFLLQSKSKKRFLCGANIMELHESFLLFLLSGVLLEIELLFFPWVQITENPEV